MSGDSWIAQAPVGWYLKPSCLVLAFLVFRRWSIFLRTSSKEATLRSELSFWMAICWSLSLCFLCCCLSCILSRHVTFLVDIFCLSGIVMDALLPMSVIWVCSAVVNVSRLIEAFLPMSIIWVCAADIVLQKGSDRCDVGIDGKNGI